MIRLIILLFSIVITSCTFGDKKDVREMSFRGVLIKNYQDDNNHGMLTFDIQDQSKTFSIISERWAGCWKFARSGDSVIKLADTTMLIIKKPTGEEKHFFYDW